MRNPCQTTGTNLCTEDEAAGMEADLEHDRADGEEWCEVGVTPGGSRSEVKYKRVRGLNYCGHPVEVRDIRVRPLLRNLGFKANLTLADHSQMV